MNNSTQPLLAKTASNGWSWTTIIAISGVVLGCIIVAVVVVMSSGESTLAAPATLTAVNVTTATLTLNWPIVTEATEYVIRSKLKTAPTYSDLATTALLAHDVTALLSNTSYNFQVAAKKGTTLSTFTPLEILTLPVITTLSTTSATETTILLTWDNEPNITEYSVETKSTIPGFTSTTTSNGFATSKLVTNLTSNTSYDFRIKASNATGEGPFSFAYTYLTLPGPIPSLSVSSITQSSFQVSWTAPPNATGYKFRYKLASESTWSASISLSTNIYSLTGLTAATIYNVSVATINSSGEGQFNTGSTVTTLSGALPDQVTGVTITNVIAGQVTIGWNALSASPIYHVQRKLSSEGVGSWTTVSSVSVLSTQITGLQGVTAYDFRVYATNNVGDGALSDVVSVTSASLPPVGAVTLSGQNPYWSKAELNWTDLAGATSYVVEYKQSTQANYTIHNVTPTTTSVVVGSLTKGLTYNFRIKGQNSGGASNDYSNVYSATIVDPPDPVLNTEGSTDQSFVVNWSAIPGAEAYDVSFSSSPIYHLVTGNLNTSYTGPIGTYTCTVRVIIGGQLTNSLDSIDYTITVEGGGSVNV